MPPREHQSAPAPQQPQQRSFTPQAPHYGFGSEPQVGPQFERHPSGHYEVVPPPPNTQNNGHVGHNPYEFIVSPNGQPQAAMNFNPKSGNFLLKIGLLVGGFVVLLIVAGILISSLAPKGSAPDLITIAERQQEIVRVATEATQQTQSPDAQNFVANVEASIASSQTGVLSYLSAHHTKVAPKLLALDKDAQTDAQLAAAASANDYDVAVTQQLAGQLQTYDQLLQSTFSTTDSPTVKQLMRSDYNGSQLLLTQAKNLENELNAQ